MTSLILIGSISLTTLSLGWFVLYRYRKHRIYKDYILEINYLYQKYVDSINKLKKLSEDDTIKVEKLNINLEYEYHIKTLQRYIIHLNNLNKNIENQIKNAKECNELRDDISQLKEEVLKACNNKYEFCHKEIRDDFIELMQSLNKPCKNNSKSLQDKFVEHTSLYHKIQNKCGNINSMVRECSEFTNLKKRLAEDIIKMSAYCDLLKSNGIIVSLPSNIDNVLLRIESLSSSILLKLNKDKYSDAQINYQDYKTELLNLERVISKVRSTKNQFDLSTTSCENLTYEIKSIIEFTPFLREEGVSPSTQNKWFKIDKEFQTLLQDKNINVIEKNTKLKLIKDSFDELKQKAYREKK